MTTCDGERAGDADSAKREPATTVSDTSAAAASTHVQTRSHISYTITGHMFGNRPMRAVVAQHRDTIALDDDTNVNIVEISIQQAQVIIQGILEAAAAAAASTSTKQE